MLTRGVLVVPVGTLLQRLPPREFVDGHALVLGVGDRLDLDATRTRLTRSGYQCVSQVIAHGEYAVRGAARSVPDGQRGALRIDLFDDEVESIRTFDPRPSAPGQAGQVRMLPAREFPLDEEASAASAALARRIDGDPKASLIYREVSEGRMPGRHRVLPAAVLRRDRDAVRLPAQTRPWCSSTPGLAAQPADFLETHRERYEQRRHDIERPLLPPRAVVGPRRPGLQAQCSAGAC
jgi:transcription-repair coupling factor (superfamily II helicase)